MRGRLIATVGLGVLVAACDWASAGGPSTPPTPPPGTVGIEMRDYAFAPATIEIAAGTTVAFVNAGHAPHTATQAGGFDTGEVKAGGIATHRFDAPGTYTFICTLHPQMTGAISVTAASQPSPAPDPTPTPPTASSPAPSATTTDEPSGEAAAGRFTVTLEQSTTHAVTAEVIDWTGLVVSAASGTPGDGASVPNGTLAIANDGPRTLRLTWAGGPCDGTDTVVLDADGRTVTVVSTPCTGDAIAFDRVLVLHLTGPVDATTLDGQFQAGGDTPG